MKMLINTTDCERDLSIKVYLEPAKVCPLCHTSFNGTVLSANTIIHSVKDRYNDTQTLRLTYVSHFCAACDSAFFGIYNEDTTGQPSVFRLMNAVPKNSILERFDNHICALSPSFVEIYSQSRTAEDINLREICGLGYRKALEFLVKDFAIYTHADKRDEIWNASLSSCIKNYIDNPKIQTLAERSAWIGNDEAHCVKKHENLDFSNLKKFIKATETYIVAEMTLEDAEAIPHIK